MGTINVYNTLNAKHEEITANGRLKDIFPDINFSHSLCLKAGNRIDGSYIVQPDDVLYVRKVPRAATTIAIIAITATVVAIGTAVGVAAYADQKSKEAQEEMEKAQRNAQNLAQQVQQLPFVRGAKNKRRLEIPCSLSWARFTIRLTTLQTDFSLFKTDQKAERTEYSVFITLSFLPATVHRELPKCLSETNVLQAMQTA